MTFKQVAEVYRINASTFGKAYRERLSGFGTWDQKAHCSDWILHEDNVGEYMSIDETAPSRGDLFTILSNKSGHGRRGSIAAMVRGTDSRALSAVFNRIPLADRLKVKEVTMDFSESMSAAVSASFPNARHTIDCFHVIQLATSALSEERMRHKRRAMKEDARLRKEHRQRTKRRNERLRKMELERNANAKVKPARGRKPYRKNKKYEPPRFANGDTAVELLTRSRFLLSQSREKWTESQKERAGILFKQYPDLLEAYELVSRLRNIFKNKKADHTSGKADLQKWCRDVESSGFEGLKAAATTIDSRIEEVANYFEERNTNVSAESLNSKLKGFRSMLRGVSDLPFFMYRVSTMFG